MTPYTSSGVVSMPSLLTPYTSLGVVSILDSTKSINLVSVHLNILLVIIIFGRCFASLKCGIVN